MSKKHFTLVGISIALVLYAMLGGFLQFYSHQEAYYLFWKDALPLVLGLAGIGLAFSLTDSQLFVLKEQSKLLNDNDKKIEPSKNVTPESPATDSVETPPLPGSDGEHKVQAQWGNSRRALAFYNKQMLNYLNPLMREFLTTQTMAFIATADAHGECDCSFRAGLPGFVHVLSDKLIAYPEYRGNGVMASVGNITENPHIGLIFIDFFESTVGLHINGKAQIVENAALSARQDVTSALLEATQTKGGLAPERWIFIEVEEAYIHCSKHIPHLQKLDKTIYWGTDEPRYKGGDAFQAKTCARPWVAK